MKKYWVAALAAACCAAVGSGAALASVLVAASENGVVAASWEQRQLRIAAPAPDRLDQAIGLDSPSPATPDALPDATAAPVFRLGRDRRDSGTAGSTATRLPEPATWAMMFVGLSMIGLATRRRRNVDIPYD